jgi:hypothetical protein
MSPTVWDGSAGKGLSGKKLVSGKVYVGTGTLAVRRAQLAFLLAVPQRLWQSAELRAADGQECPSYTRAS